jgi:hypothetical protein
MRDEAKRRSVEAREVLMQQGAALMREAAIDETGKEVRKAVRTIGGLKRWKTQALEVPGTSGSASTSGTGASYEPPERSSGTGASYEPPERSTDPGVQVQPRGERRTSRKSMFTSSTFSFQPKRRVNTADDLPSTTAPRATQSPRAPPRLQDAPGEARRSLAPLALPQVL